MQRFQLYVGGKNIDPVSGTWFDTFNPFTGEPWAKIPECRAEDVDRAVRSAHEAFTTGPWSKMTPSERGLLLYRLGDVIARESRKLIEVEVHDNGKPVTEMQAHFNYIPHWYYYYGGLADKMQGAVIPSDRKGYFNYTRNEPVGVVGVLTPWNAPLMLASWKIAPALAAGCTVVVKPSEFTSASTLELAKCFEEAGFPPGVFNVVTGFGKEVGTPLVSHPLVRKISFTGSDTTGRLVNELAAKTFKSVNLELGGKSPNIVFADANLENAVNGAVSGIFSASGQSCIAGSRLLLQDSIHDEFLDRVLAIARSARMGDPMKMETQIGPVTTQPQYEKVLNYIEIAKNEGAELRLGGHPGRSPECGNGWFVEPTIFSGVKNSMQVAQEEVFGPVLSVIRFNDEQDAVAIANDTRFGLAAGVWTTDIGRAHRMAERLQAGTVWVNCYRAISFMAPFGGYKDSGLGRENGIDGIREYLQTKSVWINTAAVIGNPFGHALSR
jgi:aldehyde dehydrogenase (NAD+)